MVSIMWPVCNADVIESKTKAEKYKGSDLSERQPGLIIGSCKPDSEKHAVHVTNKLRQ